MTTLSVFALIARQTAAEFYTAALELAALVGLPVSTWRTGDPTRTMLRADANAFETLDAAQAEFAKSGFLETAEGDWLKLRALDVYGVEAEEATFATSTVTLSNAGGGLYELAAGGLIVKNSTTGATYANQAMTTINPLTSGIAVSIVAQEAGASGSADLNAIDVIVSPALTGVTITGSTVAVGSDAQSDAGLREQCLATLGSLSPDGAADAYEYVARNSELTGIEGVSRALATGDNATGAVTVYVATTTAALDGASVAAIQAAVEQWATPLAIEATVQSGTPQTVDVALTLTPARPEMQDVAEAAIDAYFASIEFGGTIAPDAIQSAVRVAIVAAGSSVTVVSCTSPSLTVLGASAFPVHGTVVLS